jgi:hypothetical protein
LDVIWPLRTQREEKDDTFITFRDRNDNIKFIDLDLSDKNQVISKLKTKKDGDILERERAPGTPSLLIIYLFNPEFQSREKGNLPPEKFATVPPVGMTLCSKQKIIDAPVTEIGPKELSSYFAMV